MKAIIVDLDGTICNTTHRQHHMEKTPKDWKAFYNGIPEDKPNLWCTELLRGMWLQDFVILLVSGRPDDHRHQTMQWLGLNEIRWNNLYMRTSGDFRKDAILKKEIYKREIEPLYDVLFCIDDRQQVVDAWRELGLVCLQCAKGDF